MCLNIRKLFCSTSKRQSESEKKDTEEEECINQEETDEDHRKTEKITNFPENLVARSHMVALWKGDVYQ